MAKSLFLGLVACLLASAASTDCSLEGKCDAATLGQTLLQFGKNQKVAEPVTEDGDQLPQGSPKMGRFYRNKPEAKVLHSAAASAVKANLHVDGKYAVVTFAFRGTNHSFTLSRRSAYASNAKVTKQAASGPILLQHEATQARTYRANRNGIRARARIHEDGTVKGFFKNAAFTVYLEPSKDATLVEASGAGIMHDIRLVDGVDPETTSEVGDHPLDTHQVPEVAGSVNWAGDEFYPGCFPEDDELHTVLVRMAADVPAYTQYGDLVQAMVEQAVYDASFVYEQQLNVELVIDDLLIYTDAATAPDWAKDCSTGTYDEFMDYKFANMFDENKEDVIALQAFTGCGNGYGWVGVAWVGTFCAIFNGPHGVGQYNFGLNQIHGDGAWLTFAHELGHNFGADHAFDEGQGQTGGIMDYNVGGIHDGVVQFNEDYSKSELCGTLTSMSSRCPSDQFYKTPVEEGLPGGWEVTEGACAADTDMPQCIHSPNYPSNYGDGEHCTIHVSELTAPIATLEFDTKFKDFLTINGVRYRQRFSPEGVIPATTITWSSNTDSRTRAGWVLCRDV
mmetsp:Transcript_48059/g.112299  ORF Transcript_48059/g.112299 Transcript_48059/m.112299 type:complete len:563 (+) Transcript_48059:87-1775(+)